LFCNPWGLQCIQFDWIKKKSNSRCRYSLVFYIFHPKRDITSILYRYPFILFCVLEQTNTVKTLYKWQCKINNCHTNTNDVSHNQVTIKERLVVRVLRSAVGIPYTFFPFILSKYFRNTIIIILCTLAVIIFFYSR